MTSLKELASIKIAESIMETPPMIQEMVLNTTKKHIENTIISKLEVLFPILVDQILDDMINCANNMISINIDYYSLFSHIDKNIISIAIKTSKIMFEKMFEKMNNIQSYHVYNNIIDLYDRSSESDNSNKYEYDEDYEDDSEDEL